MKEITDSDFDMQVLQSKGSVLVFFGADWCSHCRVIEPAIKAIEQERENSLVVLHANVDKTQKHKENYGLKGIPTLILFQDGANVGSITGVQSREDINNFLNKHGEYGFCSDV